MPTITPANALALINETIATGIKKLHSVQGVRKAFSVHLMVQNNHKSPCLGCPHYQWVVWYPQRATKGAGHGEIFLIASPCKAPTRTKAVSQSKDVELLVRTLIKLLDQRASLVDMMSRTDRSALATLKLVRQFS